MSSIDKLAIRGIRSFSPFDEEKIEFFKPLTLILGQNGAGKTTIIESLRSMTSGTMPPHTMGGKTFIHDPRISNLPETKASIKLKFNTIKGKPVFAMRSFQLMNKKTKQEFKKLEQVLKARDERGNEISINKNCAEMDRQVPMLMGVSNAILENVVFCHQDESLWPFSDQGNLKKIFDEIFDTSKYTKALHELRLIAKKYSKYAKEFKQELDLHKKDYEQYAKLKANLNQYDMKIAEINKNIENAKTTVTACDEEIKDLIQTEEDLYRYQSEVNFFLMNLEDKSKQMTSMKEKLGFAECSEETVANKKQESEDLRANFEETIKKLNVQKSDLEVEIQNV